MVGESLFQSVVPEIEPVSLAEAKLHLRVGHGEEDAWINTRITTAREWCEEYTRRQFITATWNLHMPNFPVQDCYHPDGAIVVPRGPLQDVTSLVYVNSAGAEITLTEDTDYRVINSRDPGLVCLPYAKAWPTPRAQTDAVRLTYTSGYGDEGSDVPAPIRSAMLLLIGHLYENREDTISGTIIASLPMGVKQLLFPYRSWRLSPA